MKNVSTVALAILISLGVVACNSSGNHQARSSSNIATSDNPNSSAATGGETQGTGDTAEGAGQAQGAGSGASNSDDTAGAAQGGSGNPNNQTGGADNPSGEGSGQAGGGSQDVGSNPSGEPPQNGGSVGSGTQNGADNPDPSGETADTGTEDTPKPQPQTQSDLVMLKNGSEEQQAKTAIAKLTDTDKAAQDQESDTVKAMNHGDKIIGYKQSYASYIAVLSGNGDDKTAKYYVGFGEGGISKAKDVEVTSLSGTYKGKLSVTNTKKVDTDHLGTYSTDVTFTINNSKIQGTATFTTESDKPTETVVFTFKEGDIKQEGDALGFSGDLAIRDNTNPGEQSDERDMSGKYRGLFAGEKANQLAGTLEENNNRLSGAFAAEKQEQPSP